MRNRRLVKASMTADQHSSSLQLTYEKMPQLKVAFHPFLPSPATCYLHHLTSCCSAISCVASGGSGAVLWLCGICRKPTENRSLRTELRPDGFLLRSDERASFERSIASNVLEAALSLAEILDECLPFYRSAQDFRARLLQDGRMYLPLEVQWSWVHSKDIPVEASCSH